MKTSHIDLLYKPFMSRFRSKRMDLFFRTMKPSPEKTILDVGGTSFCWGLRPDISNVVILNLHRDKTDVIKRQVLGEGERLPFKSKSVDIVFSNSVIEHLGDFHSQRRFANEIARVGKCHFVQTPYKYCLIEPHYVSLNYHVLLEKTPKLLEFMSFRYILGRSQEERDVGQVRLLSETEFKSLFPFSTIYREKVFGMYKSMTAIYGAFERSA